MHLGNIECRLEGFKLSFKILLTESYLLHMSRVVRWPVFHRPCRYFTTNLAKAGILKISV